MSQILVSLGKLLKIVDSGSRLKKNRNLASIKVPLLNASTKQSKYLIRLYSYVSQPLHETMLAFARRLMCPKGQMFPLNGPNYITCVKCSCVVTSTAFIHFRTVSHPLPFIFSRQIRPNLNEYKD